MEEIRNEIVKKLYILLYVGRLFAGFVKWKDNHVIVLSNTKMPSIKVRVRKLDRLNDANNANEHIS